MYGFTVKRVRKSNPKKVLSKHTFFGKTIKAAKSAARRYFGRKRNVEMGFYDAHGFHPIRASSDYSGAKAGEKRARSKRAVATRVRSRMRRARRGRTAIS